MGEELDETSILRQFAGSSLVRSPDGTVILNFRRLQEIHELAGGNFYVMYGYLGDWVLSLRQSPSSVSR